MKPVLQAHRTGCGIAVAAMAGVTYARAAAAVSVRVLPKDARLWSQIAPIRRLMTAFGMESSLAAEPFRSWQQLPDCALLAIKWHMEKGRPFWHWVVFVREHGEPYVLDSNPRLPYPRALILDACTRDGSSWSGFPVKITKSCCPWMAIHPFRPRWVCGLRAVAIRDSRQVVDDPLNVLASRLGRG